ncbi:MAG TPA: hypothetical protein VGH76_16575 [Actinomycetospora sp.]
MLLHRQQLGALGDEIGAPAALLDLGEEVVDDHPRVGLDAVADAPHLPGRERRRDQPAHLRVPGRVHLDDGLPGLDRLGRQVLHQDARFGEEVLVTSGDLHQVVVGRDRPEPVVVGHLEQLVLERRMPGGRPAPAKLGERALALIHRGGPERLRGDVDGVVGPVRVAAGEAGHARAHR